MKSDEAHKKISEARSQATDDFNRVGIQNAELQSVAYWTRIIELANEKQWESIEETQKSLPWWIIGLAAGSDPDAIRQRFHRRKKATG